MIAKGRRAVSLMVFVLSSSACVALLPADALTAPVPLLPRDVRKYEFTARITKNGGVLPFKVGEKITGNFTYDLKAKLTVSDSLVRGKYVSAANSLTFQMGELAFVGIGDVKVTVSTYKHAEHFGIVAHDLKLPEEWEMDHRQGSQSYSVLLQNAPSKRVLADPSIPERLSLTDFVSFREVQLDFFHGVRFPGGQVMDRATVKADLESLKSVSR